MHPDVGLSGRRGASGCQAVRDIRMPGCRDVVTSAFMAMKLLGHGSLASGQEPQLSGKDRHPCSDLFSDGGLASCLPLAPA